MENSWKEVRVQAGPIVKAEKLTKSYQSGSHLLTVLHEVSFELFPGDTCSIVGPSGSGKTTLLGLCAGLDRPSGGSMHLAGQDLTHLSEDALAALRNREVGFVFQNFQLLPTLTALENVMVPLELLGKRSRETTQVALGLLGRVGLAERTDHYPTQLSGGEQQRVALARAFVHRPRVLFADEPTGNLDEENSDNVVELLFELNKASGTTLVLVTHNLDLAHRTQRIIRLQGGKIANGV